MRDQNQKLLNDMFPDRRLGKERRKLTTGEKCEIFVAGFLWGVCLFMFLEGITR